MSAIVVVGITYSAPRLGTFATIALVIAAQLFMGVLIDAFGMFGLERIPLNWARVSGLVLLAGGSALVLKR
jgi:transporter family-2 protein